MAKRMYRGGEDARRGRPILSGLMIGLIVGLVLAIAVALWVKASNPFKSSDKIPSQAASPPVQNAPPEPEKAPSYDFYKVLPGGDTPTAPPDPVAASPSRTQYYLQAGAFQNADDADNLKAQLALLGIEAQIKTTDVEGKGVYHRVRIGPFKAMDTVNSTRALLAQNNIEVTLVKVPSTP
jgi:cell division protein FtsN